MTIYLCDDDRRRQTILGQPGLNGIDYLEVLDQEAPPNLRQQILNVSFINPSPPAGIGPANVQIVGGERITGIQVTNTSMTGNTLMVQVSEPGDFSEYTLRLVDSAGNEPYPGLDLALSEIPFSFKVECPTDFDCATVPSCTPTTPSPPDINYLAKDFATFVTLMQNRVSLLAPRWRETSPADIGVTLIELLAYVADRLSYRQDAVATEAYLATARQRISIRRHARLVDYAIQEGCNARIWICVGVNADVLLPVGTEFLTTIPGTSLTLTPGSQALTLARQQNPQSFQSMLTVMLRAAHSAPMNFHNWGGLDCCLPAGATAATLRKAYPNLAPGDVLIFQETRGRATGSIDDADPSRRVAVRLTSVTISSDPIGAGFVPPPPGPPPSPNLTPIDITEITWSPEDALPFSIQITMLVENPPNPNLWVDSAVALANVVLADHGRSVSDTLIVPAAAAAASQPHTSTTTVTVPTPPPFAAQLTQTPLTFAAPLPVVPLGMPLPSATALFTSSPSEAVPSIQLIGGGASSPWSAVGDLLDSSPSSADFVVEIDNASVANLRSGDGDYGQIPEPGTTLSANYRIGMGTSGNVGMGTIGHLVSGDATITSAIVAISNRMPASGGVDPETIEHVRQSAPYAFRTQLRAVTPADYASQLDQRSDVQRAAATFRWTGSWYTVFNTVERQDEQAIDNQYKGVIESYLENYRVVGKDLEVDIPRFLALDIAADVCVAPLYFRGDVEQALEAVFSSQPGGVFDPANFDFGQTVYLSPLYAAAQSVPGVASIEFTQFEPRGIPTRSGMATGYITMGRLEIAQVANDPDFPERGQIAFTMRGGR
jgi:Baseplate J-like protein